MRRLVLPPGLVVALLLAGPPAHAQGVEVGIFGGYGFGGSLISSVGFQEVPIDSGVTYGATAAVEVAPAWLIEAMVSRRESQIRRAAPGVRLKVDVVRYMAGVRGDTVAGRFRAFGSFMLGATRFVPAGSEGETWFTIGMGIGAKTTVASHVGFRFEARGYYTPVSISGRVFCGGYACLVDYTGSGMFQGDASAGVFFAF